MRDYKLQTFLPYQLFEDSARCLDNKRLGKQRVECLQILNTLQKTWASPYFCEDCKKVIFQEFEGICPFCFTMWKKVAWQNHPAVQMWRNYEKSLAIYGLFICAEWVKRGYKDSCFDKIHKYIPDYDFTEEKCIDYSGVLAKEYPSPKWLGDKDFHLSHRSNLIRKNPLYYRPIFGIDIPDSLPYFWPK